MLLSNETEGFFKLQYLKKKCDFVSFLHAVRNSSKLKLDHFILVDYCHPCPGMPKVVQNNKFPISLVRDKWLS